MPREIALEYIVLNAAGRRLVADPITHERKAQARARHLARPRPSNPPPGPVYVVRVSARRPVPTLVYSAEYNPEAGRVLARESFTPLPEASALGSGGRIIIGNLRKSLADNESR